MGQDRSRHGAELARVDAQGRALGALLSHRESLSRFVADPRIPLDNNLSERVLRGPVIARYTSFGSGGPDGARAAGRLFGVLATVRLAGLNPYTWMLDWLAACARHGNQAPQQLDPWLPWHLSEQRREQLSKAPGGVDPVCCQQRGHRAGQGGLNGPFRRRVGPAHRAAGLDHLLRPPPATEPDRGHPGDCHQPCPLLSRTELGHTVCAYLRWQTPQGSNRIQLAMRLLEALERLSILALPARHGPGRGRQGPLSLGDRSAPQAPLDGPLQQLEPLRLRLVNGRDEAVLWNEFLARYHPLGYRQPIGSHLRYFLADRQGRLLGCLLYDFAARYLAVRDRWIGWQDQPHRPLERVVRQARFLLFPWVRVKCLASKVLGAELAPAGRRLAAGPRSAARSGRNLCQRPAQGNLLPGLELALSGTDPGARCLGHGASEDAQGCLRVSAAAGLAGGPARTQTPCALPLDARLPGIPKIASADLLRPRF